MRGSRKAGQEQGQAVPSAFDEVLLAKGLEDLDLDECFGDGLGDAFGDALGDALGDFELGVVCATEEAEGDGDGDGEDEGEADGESDGDDAETLAIGSVGTARLPTDLLSRAPDLEDFLIGMRSSFGVEEAQEMWKGCGI